MVVNADILVFRTNVSSNKDISQVESILNSLPSIHEWNFDLDDCDKILRIVASDLLAPDIEALLNVAGIFCQELED
jgi:hypothetical protein